MGMIANYQQTTDKKLEASKNNKNLFEYIEEIQETEEVVICDIDKMWDALHYLLTGKSATEPIENNLLSEAIVGQINISKEDVEAFISGTYSEKVSEISNALNDLDFETYMNKFNMKNFADHNIYPNIWLYEEETANIKAELTDAFEGLRNFYLKMSEEGNAVFVSIY